jgi:hypothetical protein
VKRVVLAIAVAFVWFAQSTFAQENASRTIHVFHVDESTGHVINTMWSPSTQLWSNEDLTAITGAPTTFTTSGLVSFYDSLGIEVFYESGGSINQLYWNPNSQSWSFSRRCSGCARSGSPLTGFTNQRGEHLDFVSSSGANVMEEFYNYSTKAWGLYTNWGFTDQIQSLASFADGNTTEHVFVTVSNSISELYYDGSTWHRTILGASQASSKIAAIADVNGEEIGYIQLNGQLAYFLWNTVSRVWSNETPFSSFQFPLTGTALTGFSDNRGEHFFYQDNSGYINEALFQFGPNVWTDNILSSLTGVNNVLLGTPLSSFPHGNDDQHVYFMRSQSILAEFQGSGGNWVYNILTGVNGSGLGAISSFVVN